MLDSSSMMAVDSCESCRSSMSIAATGPAVPAACLLVRRTFYHTCIPVG